MGTRALAEALTYYASEECAWCQATGVAADGACPVCNGKGKVLTLQPGVKCPGCKGAGRSHDLAQSVVTSRCAICLGSGWVTKT
jgi:DnaJ-class molecular chaperone